MDVSQPKLSPLQLELLRIYSFNPSEEELKAVRDMLARFFAKRFTDKVQEAASKQALTDQDLEEWLNSDEQ